MYEKYRSVKRGDYNLNDSFYGRGKPAYQPDYELNSFRGEYSGSC
jgi:hypothetical protein